MALSISPSLASLHAARGVFERAEQLREAPRAAWCRRSARFWTRSQIACERLARGLTFVRAMAGGTRETGTAPSRLACGKRASYAAFPASAENASFAFDDFADALFGRWFCLRPSFEASSYVPFRRQRKCGPTEGARVDSNEIWSPRRLPHFTSCASRNRRACRAAGKRTGDGLARRERYAPAVLVREMLRRSIDDKRDGTFTRVARACGRAVFPASPSELSSQPAVDSERIHRTDGVANDPRKCLRCRRTRHTRRRTARIP